VLKVPKLRKVILVSHTHWDREWYLPFEDFRWLLVKTLDQLIDLMETNPNYRFFNLDGQTIILEDYLELRPENRKRLQRLIAQKRIQIGPWYVLADEFLVSGESLIRNLLYGRQTASQFGNVMSIGYVPDAFGHIAQLPQLLNGFDITNSIWWRGLEDHGKTLPTELRWRAPDGSEVLFIHLRTSYSTAANLPQTVDTTLAQLLMPLNVLSLRGTTSAALLMNGSDHLPPQPHLPTLIQALNQRLQSKDVLAGKRVSQLLSEFGKSPLDKEVTGLDEFSPFIDELFTDFLKELKGVTFQHGTLQDYIDIVRNEVSLTELPIIKGEQHASKYIPILPGVFSSRLYLKQKNFACQQLLERWVEPFSTIAWWFGAAYPMNPLKYAWKLLLQNHPHDSICGCSVDETHADMDRRFAGVQQIGNQILSEAISYINQQTTSKLPSTLPHQPIAAFRVFNPHPWNATDIVRIFLHLPNHTDDQITFTLYDSTGQPVPFQCQEATALDPAIHMSIEIHTLPEIYSGEPHVPDLTGYLLVTFPAQDIPSLGHATFYLTQRTPDDTIPSTPALSITQEDEMYSIENSFVRLQVSTRDGSFNLYHKPTDKEYTNLHVIEDTGDVGDEYNYCPPAQDSYITTQDTPNTRISILEDGPITSSLLISTRFRIPKKVLANRQRRSSQTTTLLIQSLITVSAYSPRIDIQTKLSNTAMDHRLRVLFPTGLNTTTAWGDTPFHVTERPIKAAPQTWEAQLYPMMMDYYLTSVLNAPNIEGKPVGWFEDSTTTHALQSFVDVNDGNQGLLIATRGLPEYEVIDDEQRTIALTLLRSVGWLSRADLTTRRGHAGPELATPGAQCLGRHFSHYSVLPHPESWKNKATLQQTQLYITPMRAIQLFKTENGHLPHEQSFLSIDTPLCAFSCLKKSENKDSTILRVFDISGAGGKARIQTPVEIAKVTAVNLNEEPTNTTPLKASNTSHVEMNIEAFQIFTLQFQLKK
jgi:mannosylglycerate hydrolase